MKVPLISEVNFTLDFKKKGHPSVKKEREDERSLKVII